jgi:hypothetical protein
MPRRARREARTRRPPPPFPRGATGGVPRFPPGADPFFTPTHKHSLRFTTGEKSVDSVDRFLDGGIIRSGREAVLNEGREPKDEGDAVEQLALVAFAVKFVTRVLPWMILAALAGYWVFHHVRVR